VALLLVLSLLPSAQVTAAGPAGGGAGVGKTMRGPALPAGLGAALRRALGPRARAGTPSAAWSQQAELTPSDGAAYEDFGYSVALSGDTALIGAPFKNSDTGAVYVLGRSGATWTQQAELTDPCPCAPGDEFGDSVALNGDTALIGATGGNGDTGAAYVFGRSGTT
jgi:hypothetical protein